MGIGHGSYEPYQKPYVPYFVLHACGGELHHINQKLLEELER